MGLDVSINGHLNTLEWMVSPGCRLSFHAGNMTALKGHFHILQWMQARNLVQERNEISESAARGGHLSALYGPDTMPSTGIVVHVAGQLL